MKTVLFPKRRVEFFALTALFGLFLLFLYGPTLTIALLSFQGPNGGLTFPMNGVSLTWFRNLLEAQAVGDFAGAVQRSVGLALLATLASTLIATLAGFAFRRGFRGANALFALVLVSMITPSLLVSLGIGLMFDQLGLSPEWYSSALGAHLTWCLPFGILIMFVVFNRFNRNLEAASLDMGASAWQTARWVVLPLIFPSIIGIAMTSFTLSYDEFSRTLMTSGSHNTLPLEIYGMTTNATTPTLYALGTVTTLFSFLIISLTLGILFVIAKRRRRRTHA
ncbi:ABC transporter permease [Brenneria populi subsp. brevivirga]|uniref:ABC transporter permease n=1 Tax=Brenneria populi TaxID=1505588 RepID=UPI002E191522|nr:ABC transporter permease [Brenneria populi subsp. brevivirga]